jgi:acyl carrier protein
MERDTLDVQTFARNFESYLENPLAGGLDFKTRIEDLPSWTSLQALMVAVGFERDYGVIVSEEEFREAQTVEDLYRIVAERMAG